MSLVRFQVSLLDRCLKVCHNKTKFIHFIMSLDLNNVLRSVAIVVVGLPLSGALATAVVANLPEGETRAERETAEMKAELTRPCLDWAYSKPDSKLEREAKNEIDEYFDGEVNHAGVCKFVFS